MDFVHVFDDILFNHSFPIFSTFPAAALSGVGETFFLGTFKSHISPATIGSLTNFMNYFIYDGGRKGFAVQVHPIYLLTE